MPDMPWFFFHLHDDVTPFDEEGKELPDLEAARAQAIGEARQMSCASILERSSVNLHHRIDVADESGEVVAVVEFGHVLTAES